MPFFLKKSKKRLNFIIIVYFLVIILYGCIKAPLKEITEAEKALKAARSAEAPIYINSLYEQAEKKLVQAKQDVEKKKYTKAKDLAIESSREAKEAAAKTQILKEETRQKAERAMTSAHQALSELEEKRIIKYDVKKYKKIVSLFLELQKEYKAEQYHQVIKRAKLITEECKQFQKRL